MEHPKAVGDRTTLAVMLALEEAGYPFLIPFGENTRYEIATIPVRVTRGLRATSGA